MPGLGGVCQDHGEDVLLALFVDEERLRKVKIFLGTDGHVAAHEPSVQVEQGIAVSLKGELPGSEPFLGRLLDIELRRAPGEVRKQFLTSARADGRRRAWACGYLCRINPAPALGGSGETLDVPLFDLASPIARSRRFPQPGRLSTRRCFRQNWASRKVRRQSPGCCFRSSRTLPGQSPPASSCWKLRRTSLPFTKTFFASSAKVEINILPWPF